MSERCYEDYAVGEVIAAHPVTLTESAIIDFALQYDPQPFHLSLPGGAATFYGGLIASGWQVATLSFRLLVQAGMLGPGSLGSPGIDELRWLRPVRPGDTLYPTATVTEKRVSASKPDRGLVSISYVTKNQHGEPVLTLKSVQLVRRRDATVAA
jgi:acyl dehydratase